VSAAVGATEQRADLAWLVKRADADRARTLMRSGNDRADNLGKKS
jgi:hypothetical protein